MNRLPETCLGPSHHCFIFDRCLFQRAGSMHRLLKATGGSTNRTRLFFDSRLIIWCMTRGIESHSSHETHMMFSFSSMGRSPADSPQCCAHHTLSFSSSTLNVSR